MDLAPRTIVWMVWYRFNRTNLVSICSPRINYTHLLQLPLPCGYLPFCVRLIWENLVYICSAVASARLPTEAPLELCLLGSFHAVPELHSRCKLYKY